MKEKKIKKAAALSYSPDRDRAPKVVASGKGVIAEKIIEKAREEKIPVVEDSDLASELSVLDTGSEIPVELYEVVAEILAFVSRVDEKAGRKFKR
ncbi:MAG: flagellar biogenesis protein [Clostridiaceae bacterium]|jgi:flagellar biosynthesis protein|nr:flagellar biogenesis protein [Clostridiaceae bacterium]